MIDVWLARVATVSEAVSALPALLARAAPDMRGRTVLIKPNFVSTRNAGLSCTNPHLIAATVRFCLKHGATVRVGDSPAFGTAQAIARRTGLTDLLHPMGVRVITLKRGRLIRCGRAVVSLSADATEADLILNIPKFKAHSQMRFSGAVKNLFGCVTGVRKAWLHARHGDRNGEFVEMLCAVMDALPPTLNLMDGVEAMHCTGPMHGSAYALRLLGTSTCPVALDTAAGMLLGGGPERFPIWAECHRQQRPGAHPERLRFPLLTPQQFDAQDFLLPQTLKPESFRPTTLLRSTVKRIWLSLAGR